MSNEDLKLKVALNDQSNERDVPAGRRRLRQRLVWAVIACVVIACVAYLIAFGTKSAGSVTVEREQPILLPHATDFSITKAEGRDADEIYVTYTKKDRLGTGFLR